ncbi:MAG: 50S ribosomal protein P1 [Nitrosopumilaceae archaeon]|nr:MAG: 50S ribosomal protein L12 [Nitrosopumilales archaeon]GFN40347.1 MAG: 50S ribosomal protein L12 [Marine Group I thaumarchaeote]
MEYVYAALILHKQKKEINEENVSKIIKASGTEVNDAQVKALVAALQDVNIDEAIKAAPIVAAAPAATQEESASEGGKEKKDKKDIETPGGKSEEQAMEGLSSLFG